MTDEPIILKLGRRFGIDVARDYPVGWQDMASNTEVTTRFRQRSGRIDLLLQGDEDGRPFPLIIEVKNTDWDRMAAHRVRPNVLRHARQVSRYLEPYFERLDAGELAGLQAGIIYRSRPAITDRGDLIEGTLSEFGIMLLFYDELE